MSFSSYLFAIFLLNEIKVCELKIPHEFPTTMRYFWHAWRHHCIDEFGVEG